ncbi:MAG TPA: hypothetical protein VFD74_09080 [Thermoleophilia bacterium]|nr:hypothetical protein [Thermoleophilia bacterium]
MEMLVIVAIVAVVALVGMPTLRHTSVNAVLDGNMRNPAALVEEEMLQGLDDTYHPAGDGDPEQYLSNQLEDVLGQAEGAARYINPRAGGPHSDAILNSASILADPSPTAPAVFITNNPSSGYEVFDSQPYETSRQLLIGSLVVHFNTARRSVDVFFVSQNGLKSAQVIRLPMDI